MTAEKLVTKAATLAKQRDNGEGAKIHLEDRDNSSRFFLPKRPLMRSRTKQLKQVMHVRNGK